MHVVSESTSPYVVCIHRCEVQFTSGVFRVIIIFNICTPQNAIHTDCLYYKVNIKIKEVKILDLVPLIVSPFSDKKH